MVASESDSRDTRRAARRSAADDAVKMTHVRALVMAPRHAKHPPTLPDRSTAGLITSTGVALRGSGQ
jgi:hypothetical protein